VRLHHAVPGNVENHRRKYRVRHPSYLRIAGETGRKDFIVAHASPNVDALVTALVRGAFERPNRRATTRWLSPSPKVQAERLSVFNCQPSTDQNG